MNYTDINTIYTWFEQGDFPTATQFQATFSSFYHKNESIPMHKVDGLNAVFNKFILKDTFNSHLTDDKAHAESLLKLDASNITEEYRESLREALGVGDIPSNLATTQYVDQNAKNVANSHLTSTADGGMTQGANWTHDTSGYSYYLTGLEDKSSDTTFNRMKVQDVNGKQAFSNGKEVFKSIIPLLSQQEKDQIGQQWNNQYSYSGISIDSFLTPLVKRESEIKYVTIRGLNLNVNPQETSLKLIPKDNTVGTGEIDVIAISPNNQGDYLTFSIAGDTPANGVEYNVIIRTLLSVHRSQKTIVFSDSIEELDLSNINWRIENYQNNANTQVSITSSAVSLSGDLENVDENNVSQGTVLSTLTSAPLKDLNGNILTMNDDFIINFDLQMQKYAQAYAGMVSDGTPSLVDNLIAGVKLNGGNWTSAIATTGNQVQNSLDYVTNCEIRKRGSTVEIRLKGRTGTTNGVGTVQVSNSNVCLKLIKLVNKGSSTVATDKNGLFIKAAYKI